MAPPPTLADPSTVAVNLAAIPGQSIPIGVTCHPDPRGAPHASAALTSTMVLAIVQLQRVAQVLAQRVAALEVAHTETHRAAEPSDGSAPRDSERHRLASAAVADAASHVQITPTHAASALDSVRFD